jgi:CTP:molybdopterin cytidylyltransferase MocA
VRELDRVVVVLGAAADRILDTIDLGRAEPIICEAWLDGRSASLKAGMRALGGSHTVIVTLGDQPLIGPSVIRRFLDEPAGTRAVYDGQPGHPVVLGAEHLPAIERLEGDQGAGVLLSKGREIECTHLAPNGAMDVDTVDDLLAFNRLEHPLSRPS